MTAQTQKPAPLAFKPDLEEASRRWEAFYAGELIDRPLVCVTAPKEGPNAPPASTYYEHVHGDLEAILERQLQGAATVFYGGEAVPGAGFSFGCDEIAAFCGQAELCWNKDAGNTTWSKALVDDWRKALPLRLDPDNPLWQRMLEFYREAAARFAGKMLAAPPDLHTNMDLLAAVRGPQQLCFDVVEQPEMIDRAMVSARTVFSEMWEAISQAGRMAELGYCQFAYSMEGAAMLQCDFSCMISPEMFRRWVLPALEEEAAIVKHAIYHWDGPEALVHTDDLVACRGLHALSYVPGTGNGSHYDNLALLKRVQAGGKAVHAGGSPAELKAMHRELRPDKVIYTTGAGSQAEAEALLDWFVKHT